MPQAEQSGFGAVVSKQDSHAEAGRIILYLVGWRCAGPDPGDDFELAGWTIALLG